MLILAIILFGMIAGGLAQMVLGQSMRDVNWTLAILTGLIGSFVGALLLTLAWGWYDKRRSTA